MPSNGGTLSPPAMLLRLLQDSQQGLERCLHPSFLGSNNFCQIGFFYSSTLNPNIWYFKNSKWSLGDVKLSIAIRLWIFHNVELIQGERTDYGWRYCFKILELEEALCVLVWVPFNSILICPLKSGLKFDKIVCYVVLIFLSTTFFAN